MNILGIYGAIGWDGNKPTPEWTAERTGSKVKPVSRKGDYWVHGSGVTLIMDGELKNSMCEERFSRIKYEGNFPVSAIEKILDHNKLTKYDIDLVVYVGCPILDYHLLRQSGQIEKLIKEYFPKCKVEFSPHHVAHAGATFYTSGFEEANILTFDAAGDYEFQPDLRGPNPAGGYKVPHMKFYHGKDLTILELPHSNYCNSPPMATSFGSLYNMYSMMAYATKMKTPESEHFSPEVDAIHRETYPGKVMGLAVFGDYQKIDLPEWYDFERTKHVWNSDTEWEECFPQLYNTQNDYWMESTQYKKLNPDDLAAWTQHQFEKYLLLFLSHIPKEFKHDNLCLGGGCALNILANSKIIEQGIYKNVHVNTAPNDDGLHFGAALCKSAEYEHKITLPDDIGYLGTPYTDEDIEAALSDFSFIKFSSGNDFLELCQWVVEDLKENKVVAWFQGKSEFGPRALGNRSILVNPIFDNKDYLNSKVKYREYWRPYAPIVIEEETKHWFDLPVDKSPHMLFNSFVVEDKRKQIPSVVHEDGSARVQTVSKINNKKIYMLLQEFFKETGVPVLLNTSFNVGGEPIVESPADAVKTFAKSNIDILIMHNYYCCK